MNQVEQYLELCRLNELERLEVSRVARQLEQLKAGIIEREKTIAALRRQLLSG